jgi:hypothetical protein
MKPCRNPKCVLPFGHNSRCKQLGYIPMDVTNAVTNTVTNEAPKADAGSAGVDRRTDAASRQRRWREANREKYNERQRELMRRKRAGGVPKETSAEKGTPG